MKLIVFILTAVLQLAAAAAAFLILLLVLNGYSESQATPSLISYIAIGIGSAMVMGIASSSIANRLVVKKSFSRVGASALAVLAMAIVGWVVVVLAIVCAVVVAELVRSMR
ncbi:MAG TPA: hypothetical protein VJU86_15890 [Pyrinomonadaceae bacterium]|nr:hypothetical protein [Pyrinomonadaceae bacterium]